MSTPDQSSLPPAPAGADSVRAPELRSGDGLGVLGLAYKLGEIHRTVSCFMGDNWPKHRDDWQAIIRAKAARENKQDLAAAIELAKDSPVPMQSLVILAAAYELASPNTEVSNSGA